MFRAVHISIAIEKWMPVFSNSLLISHNLSTKKIFCAANFTRKKTNAAAHPKQHCFEETDGEIVR